MILCEGAKIIWGDWLDSLMRGREPQMTKSNLAAAIEHFKQCREPECLRMKCILEESLRIAGKKEVER